MFICFTEGTLKKVTPLLNMCNVKCSFLCFAFRRLVPLFHFLMIWCMHIYHPFPHNFPLMILKRSPSLAFKMSLYENCGKCNFTYLNHIVVILVLRFVEVAKKIFNNWVYIIKSRRPKKGKKIKWIIAHKEIRDTARPGRRSKGYVESKACVPDGWKSKGVHDDPRHLASRDIVLRIRWTASYEDRGSVHRVMVEPRSSRTSNSSYGSRQTTNKDIYKFVLKDHLTTTTMAIIANLRD